MTQHRMTAVVCAAALVAGLVGFAAPPALAAQEEPVTLPISWEEQIDAFFARVAEGERTEAVDALYAGSPLAEDLGDPLEELKAQLAELPEAVGEYLGHERIAVQPLGERFVYVWHLAYFEERPFQIHFSFYRPKDRWVIFQLAFDHGVARAAQDLARRRLAESGGD